MSEFLGQVSHSPVLWKFTRVGTGAQQQEGIVDCRGEGWGGDSGELNVGSRAALWPSG